MYKGAKWLGTYPITAAGRNIKPGDVVAEMTESEAQRRRGWEPVYEGGRSEKKKERKKEDNE